MADDAPVANKTEISRLRRRMAADGFEVGAIATALMRCYGCRPRRAWRLAHGLSQTAMAERFNARFGKAARAPMSASRISGYERWPARGERPSPGVLCSLAELYGARPGDLIDDLDLRRTPEPDRQALRDLIRSVCDTATQPLPDAGLGIAYRRWEDEPDYSRDARATREVVVMTAHEGSERAEDAERRDIGDATLDQLRADVVRLSQDFMTGDPFPMLQEMRRVRSRIYAVLDRRLWPRDQMELYFLLGALSVLMANAADFLGHPQAAEELVRAGWAYATAIDHRPLLAQLRLQLASIAYWDRPRQSRDLARSGLQYLSDGSNAAQLHLEYGRAAARIGDTETARQAIAAAHEARTREHNDELLELGGEFRLSLATQHWLAGGCLIEIPGAEGEAIAELEQATSLYTAGPQAGEQHSDFCAAIAHIDLATARLREGQLEAAAESLQPVLSLSPNRRIDALPQRFHRVRAELATAPYRGHSLARALDENIESFCRETIVSDLHEFPFGSG